MDLWLFWVAVLIIVLVVFMFLNILSASRKMDETLAKLLQDYAEALEKEGR